MSITVLLTLVWMHFVADFVMQSHYMSMNKSKDSRVLLLHVCVYSIPFFWFGWMYAVVNATLHFMTDFVSSRITSYLWKKEEVHWFFVVIGVDQALHMTALLLTYYWMI